LKTLTTRITLLQKEKDLSRAAHLSLSRQLQQQQSLKASQVTSTDTVTAGNSGINTVHNDPNPSTANTTTTAANDRKPSANDTISSTLEAMLEKYDELDEDSRKMLIQHAITTDNAVLQQCLMELRASQGNKSGLAKLTKEIIKLADTYKVPELRFDEQASKRLFNFQNWIMKLRPILAMFPQTATVFPGDTIISLYWST
jgi:hypothetical protein